MPQGPLAATPPPTPTIPRPTPTPPAAPPPRPMSTGAGKRYTVQSPDGQREVTFEWHKPTPPTDVDFDAIFAEAGQQPSDRITTAASKATGIGPGPGLRERAERTLPFVGGVIGGVTGGIPGAALGGAAGTALQTLSATQRRGLPPRPGALPSADTPAQAGTREAINQALHIGGGGVEQAAYELGGRAVGSVVRGAMRPAQGTTDASVAATNEALDLRLGAHEINPTSKLGVSGQMVHELTSYSFFGNLVNTMQRKIGTRNALQGAANGAEAFKRIGKAYNEVINAGPAYDMLPHKIEATRLFGQEVAPKLLELRGAVLSPKLRDQLSMVSNGDLAPTLVLKVIRDVRGAIQAGSKAPVPTGILDTLESILATKDTIQFGSGTALRTSLRELGEQGDALLGERAKSLAHKFESDLTAGLSAADRAYPPGSHGSWDDLRALYRQGAQGLEKGTPAQDLLTQQPVEQIVGAKSKASTLLGGRASNEDAITNLTMINEAMQRRGSEAMFTGAPFRKIIRIAELGAIATAGAGGRWVGGSADTGIGAALGAATIFEALPAAIAWAAHSPMMTKLLTQGFTSLDTSAGAAAIGRVMGAYFAQLAPSDTPASMGGPGRAGAAPQAPTGRGPGPRGAGAGPPVDPNGPPGPALR